jgi:type II secretory ATPase GspE/PulE/Tfp pilus assembly ATPase PilB-like protein
LSCLCVSRAANCWLRCAIRACRPNIRTYHGAGCAQCNGTGFNGRVGLFEIFEIDDDLRRMVMQRQDAAAIRSVAVNKGMKTLFQDGLVKVLMGETTISEIQRVAV